MIWGKERERGGEGEGGVHEGIARHKSIFQTITLVTVSLTFCMLDWGNLGVVVLVVFGCLMILGAAWMVFARGRYALHPPLPSDENLNLACRYTSINLIK